MEKLWHVETETWSVNFHNKAIYTKYQLYSLKYNEKAPENYLEWKNEKVMEWQWLKDRMMECHMDKGNTTWRAVTTVASTYSSLINKTKDSIYDLFLRQYAWIVNMTSLGLVVNGWKMADAMFCWCNVKQHSINQSIIGHANLYLETVVAKWWRR